MRRRRGSGKRRRKRRKRRRRRRKERRRKIELALCLCYLKFCRFQTPLQQILEFFLQHKEVQINEYPAYMYMCASACDGGHL